jgi:ubiquitin-conjugating enzyme E2 D/E
VSISFEGDDVAKWNVKILGPENTPYYGGVFILFMDFSQGYPFKAPRINFKTKVYHPNIRTESGEICA